MALDYVYERRLGTSLQMGTNFPIEIVVRRNGRRDWIAYTLCNGDAGSPHRFATKREACAFADEYEYVCGPFESPEVA